MVVAQRTLGPCATVLFGHEQGKYPDGNSVLVRGTEQSVLIDPALCVHSLAPVLEVHTVLLTHTHEDHAAGVSAVRYDELRVHTADLDALRSVDGLMRLYGLPDDQWPAMSEMVRDQFHFEGWPEASGLDDGETLELGEATVTVVHAPGHTSGHSVFLVEQCGGPTVVVTGDIDLSTFGPYYGDASSSLDDFEATLELVAGLEADHYVTFHHKGVVDGHAEFGQAVHRYASVFDRREETLLGLLDRPRAFEELVATGIVYRPGTRPPVFGESVERRSIEQHLRRLVADGAVELVDGQYVRR